MQLNTSNPESTNSHLTVLFDGGCPLCAREIRHYQNMQGAGSVNWVDITKTPDLEQLYGVSFETAMARFHVRDQQGQWQTGAYGFVALWKNFRFFRLAAAVLQTFRLVGIADWVYGIFAKRRLKSRCADGACEI